MKRILIDSSFAAIMRELMDGITLYVNERHAPWQLYTASAHEFQTILHSHPDGCLALLPRPSTDIVATLRRLRIPAVNMLRNLHPILPSVASDHHAIGAAAADYFLSRAFKHFAFLGTNREWSDDRLAGFSSRLKQAGHAPLLRSPIINNDLFRRVGSARLHSQLGRWLAALPRPVALFAAADYIARPTLEVCEALRIAVPDQISILGVDNDIAICALGAVPLSSIPQNFMRIGFEAARMLDGIMAARRHPRAPLCIPPRDIVVRRSTDFIAASDPHVAAALRLIHAHDREIPSVKTLLHHVGLSRQWLDAQFKLAIGRTASDEIRRTKLARARTLLLTTHLPIHEIARRCGFSHPENLARFLHDHTGLSPTQLRNT